MRSKLAFGFFVLVLVACGAGLKQMSTSSVGEPSPDTVLLKEVPILRQATDYTCGASALQGVLAYYGHDFDEKFVAEKVESHADHGTDHRKMADYARSLGLKVEILTKQNIAALKAHVAKKNPLIVAFQAWPTDEVKGPPLPYAQTWDLGHYAVVIGVDDKNVYFMDPSHEGRRGFIAHAEFMERWHDIDDGKPLEQMMMTFEGKPAPVAAWKRTP